MDKRRVTAGIIAIILAILGAVYALVDSDPTTKPDPIKVISEVNGGIQEIKGGMATVPVKAVEPVAPIQDSGPELGEK
jgi:hypothetical protein